MISYSTVPFTGLFGIAGIFGIGYLFSAHRTFVRWDTIVKAFLLQVVLAWFILKTSVGVLFFKKLSAGFQMLYSFADQGASFVFGSLSDASMPWGMIFGVKVIPIIIFFGALMSVLFHLKIVQKIVGGLAFVIKPILGTSGAETLCAVANSMLGQTEAPLLIKNYLKDMTDSEIFVVMVSGFATLSGAILAVYGSMGVPMDHLLAASVMAIPSSLLMAKLLMPETEDVSKRELADMEPETKNVLDAISTGTSDGLSLAVNVGAMLISFISLIALANYLLGAVTGLIFGSTITLNVVFGKVFGVFAYLIGIPGHEVQAAGALLGTKLVVNEFVAYTDMLKTSLSPRSVSILTYALCGFANFSCIGIQIGGIGALVPKKRHKLISFGMRALLAGNLANFLNAALASLLI